MFMVNNESAGFVAVSLPIEKIRASNETQSRKTFREETIQGLADSIKAKGLLNAIRVRRAGKDLYTVVNGERRLRAARLLGWKTIPAIVEDASTEDKSDMLAESLIENVHREDLSQVERDDTLIKLWRSGRYKTHAELAREIGYSVPTVKKLIDVIEFRERIDVPNNVSTWDIADTADLDDQTRKLVIEKIARGELKQRESAHPISDTSRLVKVAPPALKEALLSDRLSYKEAKSLYDQIIDIEQRTGKPLSKAKIEEAVLIAIQHAQGEKQAANFRLKEIKYVLRPESDQEAEQGEKAASDSAQTNVITERDEIATMGTKSAHEAFDQLVSITATMMSMLHLNSGRANKRNEELKRARDAGWLDVAKKLDDGTLERYAYDYLEPIIKEFQTIRQIFAAELDQRRKDLR